MIDQCDPKRLVNKQLAGTAYITIPDASLVAYQQRWEREIASRFREAKKRFPEFFPSFELLESPGKGLQYSIHFEPLTEHSKALIDQTPLFPHHKEFKPIEQLWQEDGSSELDILFERFPTQLALLPPKKPWGYNEPRQSGQAPFLNSACASLLDFEIQEPGAGGGIS